MEKNTIYSIITGKIPIIAAAIHNGHEVRDEVSELFNLSEAERLREEDPFTGDWTTIAETRIIGLRSRFEVDLNRSREKAVYIEPDDAWGLQVWKSRPSIEIVELSLLEYDEFYNETSYVLKDLQQQFGKFVVFDLHTYNHMRGGPDEQPADPISNPEVNVGTGTLDREHWAPVVERFMSDLHNFDYLGRHLDVRENVKFKGGNFPRWINENFDKSGCALAIEFKKFFMNEWTGEPDKVQLEAIRQALKSTVAGVVEELAKL
ncbi:MAG: N-formylglutamate amidohydrolase [Ignavibacteria bacterium]|nr:N-formylglutamate amidohydrolase [Ignavibacteria bacterium]